MYKPAQKVQIQIMYLSLDNHTSTNEAYTSYVLRLPWIYIISLLVMCIYFMVN